MQNFSASNSVPLVIVDLGWCRQTSTFVFRLSRKARSDELVLRHKRFQETAQCTAPQYHPRHACRPVPPALRTSRRLAAALLEANITETRCDTGVGNRQSHALKRLFPVSGGSCVA